MPAQAGIQGRMLNTEPTGFWTPAFAGVTVGMGLRSDLSG